MSLHLDPAAPALDLSRRLGPAPSFNDATARVEEALDALRAAEASLERQLSDLRLYLRNAPIQTDDSVTIDMAA